MDWKIFARSLAGLLVCILIAACSISYKFNGGSLDYTRIKTIEIPAVVNRAAEVYPPLAANFTEQLQDFYTRRTRLDMVSRDADLLLECEVVGYDLSPMAIKEDSYAERTIFALSVKVRYVNRVDEKESFDRTFRVQRDFGRDESFPAVRDALLEEMTEELIKQIYNATVENW